jgi:hypothetical protein
VGALAHYLESEGIPTTQISLIREHTATIKPPRALWVPFELGRPLGAPGNQGFQRRVLLAALELLDAPQQGPLLVDFPDEAPEEAAGGEKNMEGWSCPVTYERQTSQETDLERLRSDFKREVAELRPWYDLSLKKRDRTAVVEFSPDSASELLGSFAVGEKPVVPQAHLSLATALRLAAQDLKAFYFEAATARPGSASPSSGEFNRWFWQETAAGRILKAAKERCLKETDKALKMTGAMLLVPLDQV